MGDGDGDGLLFTLTLTLTPSPLLGNGDGTFQNPLTYAVDNGLSSLAVGAFKDARELDIVVVNTIANSVSILLNSCNPINELNYVRSR